MRKAACLLLVLTFPAIAYTSTIHVPGDQPTIQQAIDMAVNGDTVLVAPGTYVENIDFKSKAITVTSSDGAIFTIIDGSQPKNPDLASVVYFIHNEGLDSVLDGFTIEQGYGTLDYNTFSAFGGGIYCKDASPTIRNNVIKFNTASAAAGILIIDSNALIQNNLIHHNTPSGMGGGIMVLGGAPVIEGNTILEHTTASSGGGGGLVLDGCKAFLYNNIISNNLVTSGGGGIYITGGIDILIMNCSFTGNVAGWGGAIHLNNSVGDLKIVNCNFIGNKAPMRGGAFDLYKGSCQVLNSIFWDNKTEKYGDVAYIRKDAVLNISYSDVENGKAAMETNSSGVLNWGAGMIEEDPLFTSATLGFHYLSQKSAGQPEDSPCLDAGSHPAGNLGMDLYWTRTDGQYDTGMVDIGFHYGSFPIPPLFSDIPALEENVGGAVRLNLNAGPAFGNRNYLILGSIIGINPGTMLPGGYLELPLYWDYFTNIVISNLNTPVFDQFLGKLDASGAASATFDTLAPIPGAAGLKLYFAYALNGPFNFASNPVGVRIEP